MSPIKSSQQRRFCAFRFLTITLLFVAGCGILVPSQVPAQQPAESAELNPENMAAWRTHIRPTNDELAWTQIDWFKDLQSGIEEAKKTGKPMLLWTMNGHPFGCT